MVKCVGVQKKAGVFTDEHGRDKTFDNVVFHLVSSAPLGGGENYGMLTDTLKVKRAALEQMLGGFFNPMDFVDHELILEFTPISGKPQLTGIQPIA